MEHIVGRCPDVDKQVGLAVEVDVWFANPFNVLPILFVVLAYQLVGLEAEVGLLSFVIALNGQAVAPSASDVVEGHSEFVVATLWLVVGGGVSLVLVASAGCQQKEEQGCQ